MKLKEIGEFSLDEKVKFFDKVYQRFLLMCDYKANDYDEKFLKLKFYEGVLHDLGSEFEDYFDNIDLNEGCVK